MVTCKTRDGVDVFVARAAECVPARGAGDDRADAAAVPRVPAAEHAAATRAHRPALWGRRPRRRWRRWQSALRLGARLRRRLRDGHRVRQVHRPAQVLPLRGARSCFLLLL